MKLHVSFRPQTLTVSVNPQTLGVGFGNPVARDYSQADIYDGEYSVVPRARETQTLNTLGKLMLDNVTIAPIPSNYGEITWDGSVLTVS